MADDQPTLDPDGPEEEVADVALAAAKTEAEHRGVKLRSMLVFATVDLGDGQLRSTTAATGERYEVDDPYELGVEMLTDLLLRAETVAKSIGKTLQVHTVGQG